MISKNPDKLKSKNAAYACKVLAISRNNSDHGYSKNELWSLVIEAEPKKHNSQMDVVLALWNNKLISGTPMLSIKLTKFKHTSNIQR